MHDLAERRLAGQIPDTLILLEHPPVFTGGRRAKDEELLWDADDVAARGGLVRRIDRGGSFTFHGPGQLVGYPVLHLGTTPDAARYLRVLEESIIAACADLGAHVSRRPDVQTGVWAGDEKVCAIGVRLMRTRVTLHGFALNADPDLSWFDGIVACGLPDHGVTSLSRILDREVTVAEVRPAVETRLAQAFDLALEPAPREVAEAFTAGALDVA
jgi:lipoyl(octanoyl) transferase